MSSRSTSMICFSKVRLSGSTSSNMGRVDVMINGKWGMICGDRWTMKNSMVVCRQLGLGFSAKNYSTKHFGRIGKVLLSGITCHGNETSLDECLRHDNLTCSQTSRIAAVSCRKGEYFVYRVPFKNVFITSFVLIIHVNTLYHECNGKARSYVYVGYSC